MSLSKDSIGNRNCWICFSEETSAESVPETSSLWIEPCSCTGTTKWVHQTCLQQWIDRCMRDKDTEVIKCPNCQYPYKIYFMEPNSLFRFMDKVFTILGYFEPVFLTSTILISIYWLLFTYGALTILQVYGKIQGLYILYNTSPVTLFLIVPFIPFTLISFQYNEIDDYLTELLFNSSMKFIKIDIPEDKMERYEEILNVQKYSVTLSSILFQALAYPTMSIFFGKFFSPLISNPLGQLACGAVTFLFVKSTISVIHKRYSLFYLSKRRVLNHFENLDNN